MSNEHEPPRPDPLIDEIRAIRRDISDRFGNDVHKLAEYLQQIERQHPERLASPEQLRPSQPSHK